MARTRALVGLAGPVAGDAVADGVEPAKLFDVEMDDLARCGAFIARPGIGGFDGREPAEAAALQDAADGGRRQAEFVRNPGLSAALPAQHLDRIAGGGRRLAWR